jgi:hypothetical protein
MTVELATRISSRLNGASPVTPKQIDDHLSSKERSVKVNPIFDSKVPDEIKDTFFRKGKVIDAKRFAKFMFSVLRVSEIHNAGALSFLTLKCIRKNGSINIRRLDRILKRG